MYCTKCGKEIPDGEKKICDDCQKKLLEEIESEEKEVIIDNSKKNKKEKNKVKKDKKNKQDKKKDKNSKEAEKEIAQEENSEKTKFKIVDDKTEKKFNITYKIITVICAIFICASLLILAMCIYSKSINNVVGNTIGNCRNSGFAADQGNWIYYLAPNEDGTKVGIFKIKNDGTNKQELYMSDPDIDITSLNVYGNYIYFISINSGEYKDDDKLDNKICRMKLNGSNLEIINDNEFNNYCYEIYVIKNSVYYIGIDANVYRMDLNGKNKELVSDKGVGYLGVSENYIIYNTLESEDSTKYVTYIMNIDGTNERPILEDERLEHISVEGDYVYYINSERNICRTKIDSNQSEILYNVEAHNFNVKGNYGYYLDYLDSESNIVCIYRVKLDGSSNNPEKIKELETKSRFIDIVGDWIFYMDYTDTSSFINLVKSDCSGDVIQLFLLDYSEYIENTTNNSEE